MALQEPQAYCLKNLTEIEAYLLDEFPLPHLQVVFCLPVWLTLSETSLLFSLKYLTSSKKTECNYAACSRQVR